MRNVLGNWQFSGLVTAQTGRPFTALASGDVSNTGISMDRAFISGPAYGSGSCAANGVTTPCKDLLNPNSFSDPAPGTFGNIGKGALRFPGYYNWNMAATKNFQLTERFRLQFRFEFFNVFNRVNYLDDDNTVANVATNGGSNFGNIQNSYDPRIGQAALKLFF